MPPKGRRPEETPEERRRRLLQQQQQPATTTTGGAEDGLSDEEEPEGEDLFGDDYLRDYGSDADSSEGIADDDDIPEEGEVVGDNARPARRPRAALRTDGYEDDGFIVDDDEMDEEGGDLSFAARMEVERRLEARHREERDVLQQQYKAEDRERKREERRRARQGLADAALLSSTSDTGGSDDDDDGSSDGGGSDDGGRITRRRGGKRSRDDPSDDDNDAPSRRGGDRRRGGAARGAGGGAASSSAAAKVQQLFGISIRDTPESAAKYSLEDELYLHDSLADEVPFDWTKPQGALTDWLATDLPRRVAKNRIFHFLSTFSRDAGTSDQQKDASAAAAGGRFTYREALTSMVQNNDQSFELSYWDLGAVYGSTLAIWLADVPEILIGLLEEAANYLLFRILFPHYERVHKHIFVRLSSLPVCDPIRDFRQIHMNVIVRVEGVVIRRSPIYPQLQAVKYDCARCSFIIGPIVQRGDKEVAVSQCPSCHSKGPFRINMALTEYRNHQTIVLQEPPGKVPPGRLPRSLEVILTNDLIDRANPGEEVEVTGVYTNSFDPVLNSKQGFPVFTTILNANNISRRVIGGGDSAPGGGGGTQGRGIFARLPDADKQVIIKLSQHPNIKQKLMQSIAPSIHGREDIKLGLLLSLLGGVPKDVGGDQSHRIRGDLNVLLVGDPGCAKSQFLKFVEMTADRAVFTTGRGSTAVGLTAALHKDPITGDFTLEGGALVIADKGICLIDEFDKMSDADRTSIHEAMEQQTISVAKGGIVTTLSARCSVIAAANPIGGRYDPSVPFDANVNLTTPILSRFDMLFVVRDEINPEADLRLATFICGSHFKNHPTTQKEQKEKENAIAARTTELRQQFRQLDEAEVHLAREIEECVTQLMEHDKKADNDAMSGIGGGDEDMGIASEAIDRDALLERHSQLTQHNEEVQALKAEILAELQQLTDQQKPGGGGRQGTTVEDLDCNSTNPLPQRVLKQYIAYARHHCTPRVTNIDSHMITRVYTELRQESKLGGLPITVRHMESLVRLTEAHARIHLRGFAVDEDVTAAVAVFLRCFLATQKYSARMALTRRFDKYLHRDKEPLQLIHFRVKLMVAQTRQLERQVSGGVEPVTIRIETAEVEAIAASVGVGKDTVATYYKSPTFNQEFALVHEEGEGGMVPRYITHTIIPE